MRRGEIVLTLAAILGGASIPIGIAADKIPYRPSQIDGQNPLNCASSNDASAYALKGTLIKGDTIRLGGGKTLTNNLLPVVELSVGESGEGKVDILDHKTPVTSNGTQASFVDAGIRYDVLSDSSESNEVVLFDIILSCTNKA